MGTHEAARPSAQPTTTRDDLGATPDLYIM